MKLSIITINYNNLEGLKDRIKEAILLSAEAALLHAEAALLALKAMLLPFKQKNV